jgi:hypothetical protein
MPEVDGKIILKLDPVEGLDLFWAVTARIRELSDQRRIAEGLQLTQIENEIVRLGSLLNKLPAYKRKGE